ncbi:hypothetical protein B0H11DRAFT_2207409 [Mycena galericulata]|nr:hypothetical protein B0H11DRAFT_2207409 [Mycena galericulata]
MCSCEATGVIQMPLRACPVTIIRGHGAFVNFGSRSVSQITALTIIQMFVGILSVFLCAIFEQTGVPFSKTFCTSWRYFELANVSESGGHAAAHAQPQSWCLCDTYLGVRLCHTLTRTPIYTFRHCDRATPWGQYKTKQKYYHLCNSRLHRTANLAPAGQARNIPHPTALPTSLCCITQRVCAPCLAGSGMSAENDIQLHTQRWAHNFVAAVHARLDAGAGRDLRVSNQTTRRTASAWLSRRALWCITRYPGPGRSIQAACVRAHPGAATVSSPSRAYRVWIATMVAPGAAPADLGARDLEGAVPQERSRLAAHAALGHEVPRHGAWLWVPPDTERWMWHARLTLLAMHALLTSGCGSEMRFCVVDFISGL